MTFHVPNKHRARSGPLGSDESNGNNGAFLVPLSLGQKVRVIASDGDGWEHVSVSRSDRCPTWDEMSQIKDLFWDAEDTVVQYHPPKSQYVNVHPYCLHLWRMVGEDFPRPPKILVG